MYPWACKWWWRAPVLSQVSYLSMIRNSARWLGRVLDRGLLLGWQSLPLCVAQVAAGPDGILCCLYNRYSRTKSRNIEEHRRIASWKHLESRKHFNQILSVEGILASWTSHWASGQLMFKKTSKSGKGWVPIRTSMERPHSNHENFHGNANASEACLGGGTVVSKSASLPLLALPLATILSKLSLPLFRAS